MKHVLGPYKATPMNYGDRRTVWWIDGDHGREPFGNLATVWSGFNHSPEEIEATARLFVGSPALLEALEWLIRLDFCHGEGCTPDEWADATAFAMEAIARAKGEHDEE